VAALGEHGLRVELHAVDRQLAVPQRHDDPRGRGAGDLQLVRHGVGIDRQRVVAGRGEGRRQTGEDAGPLVHHLAGLPVQELRRPDDLGTERLGDRLMAQADAQDRRSCLGGGAHHRHGHPGVGRRPRAGREQHSGDVEVGQLLHAHGVVASHDAPHAQLPEVLDEVVDEAVEVVDDEDRPVDGGHRVHGAGDRLTAARLRGGRRTEGTPRCTPPAGQRAVACSRASGPS
jgi:hypothetical protein